MQWEQFRWYPFSCSAMKQQSDGSSLIAFLFNQLARSTHRNISYA